MNAESSISFIAHLKVLQPSRKNRKSYDIKFVIAECACHIKGATLNVYQLSWNLIPSSERTRKFRRCLFTCTLHKTRPYRCKSSPLG